LTEEHISHGIFKDFEPALSQNVCK